VKLKGPGSMLSFERSTGAFGFALLLIVTTVLVGAGGARVGDRWPMLA
jgi:hypothetical protein